ncbi:MAG: methyltransferase domain-containing protein [Stappiaceae bacterium]
MTDQVHLGAVTEFYDTHPINEQQILDKLRQDGFDPNDISEDILQNYDQDHYGGTEANDALAALAAINSSCHVLDVCSGVGGPSRYLAHNYGCQVTGIDLTESRIATATRLTALAGLEHLVTYKCANALDLPLPDGSIDVVISQEAFCHIPDKNRLISECTRVLKPGGRIAFSDILTTDTTRSTTRRQLQQQLTFTDLVSQQTYRQLLEQNGCKVEFHDLAKEWRSILADRLAMYRSLKQQTVDRYGEAHFQKWDDAYSFFVGLYETGELTGGRFLAVRSDSN